MLVETDLAGSWLRRLLPKADTQNSVGLIPPANRVQNRVALCAHLDTHRTPIFYSSKSWHRLFGRLVAGAFVSLVVGAAAYALGGVFDWPWVRWLGLAAPAIQLFFLGLCLHADRTPFLPGANDDASGVGVILAIAERLSREPLAHTEVWLAFTDCVETIRARVPPGRAAGP